MLWLSAYPICSMREIWRTPQPSRSKGAGKSLALQWLKAAMDGRQLVEALRAAGHPTDKPDLLVDLIFGTGMAPAWRDGETEVKLARKANHAEIAE